MAAGRILRAMVGAWARRVPLVGRNPACCAEWRAEQEVAARQAMGLEG